MSDVDPISAVLTELSSTANAAMTADQREKRAQGVLSAANMTVEGLTAALRRPDEPWNVTHALSYGVPVDTWMHAIEIAGPPPETLGQLLDTIHRAESAVAMLKAGYRASRDEFGKLTWNVS